MATGKTKDGRGAFLFSPTLDAAAFLLPISLAILFTPTAWLVPKQQVPLWAHLILVVSNDVAHVWATAFRVYLDRREFVRRAAFYTAAPIVAFVVAFTLHYFGSATHFWTALAYYAMFHFVKQDFGLIALFVARSGIRPTKQQMQREKITLYVGAGVPVLLWHGSRPEAFRWFSAGERFIFTTPEPLVPPLVFMYAATLLTYVANELWQWRRGAAINAGKLFVMSAAWVTWGVGVGFEHEVLSLAWINLFHGIPYMVMIGVYCRNRWACLPPSACSDQVLVFLTQRWQVFVAALVGVAMLEDVLWDLFVWQDYLPAVLEKMLPDEGGSEWELPEFGPLAVSAATAALSIPQITHYMLDAYIWRFDGSNPGLRDYLLGGQPSSTGATASTPPPPSASHAGEAAANEHGDVSAGEGGEQVARSEEPSKDASA